MKQSAAPDTPRLGHPLGFWFIFSGELAERSSFYGMRAILFYYILNEIEYPKETSLEIMHYFMAACYLLPLVGGWIADNLLGKYWTIVGFSIPYILGHVVLGFPQPLYLFIALGLLAMGSGVTKPNISPLMGMTYDQQRPGQEQLRSDAFAMFYLAINIGAAISSFVMPILRDKYDYQIAFLFPAALMVLAFSFFAAGKPFYAREVVVRRRKTRQEWIEQWRVLRRLLGVFAVVVFFWAIFDQSTSTWTSFSGDHLERHVFRFDFLSFLPGRLYEYEMPPDQLQFINPVLIILLLPLVTATWHLLRRVGIRLRPTDKMLIGFVLTGLSMVIMSAAGYLAGDGLVTVWWEIAAYVVITIAEICISVVGLELAFSAAPKSMKSFVTACWLLPVFVANLIDVRVTPLYTKMEPGGYFGVIALVMIPVTLVFVVVAWWFNQQQAIEQAGQPAASAAH